MTDGKLSPHAILIVENDWLLKLLAIDIVKESGFVALEAGNADEAVVILESRSDIALLLTDINMPGSMDGLKLAHAVRKRWPPIRIIVVSGAVRPAECDLPTDSRFFGKPYRAEAMILEIHSLIGAKLELRPQQPRLRPHVNEPFFAQTWRRQCAKLTTSILGGPIQ